MSVSYRSGFKYQLVRDYSLQTSINPERAAAIDFAVIGPGGLLLIKKGYAWDGPSGPVPDIPEAMRGSLVHDALYELIRIGGLDHTFKKDADALLCSICMEDGMPPFWAKVILEGVAFFGERFTEAAQEAKTITVGEDKP